MPEIKSTIDAQYALDFVKEICEHVGPVSAGSPQELEKAAMTARELETHRYLEKGSKKSNVVITVKPTNKVLYRSKL